MAEKVTNIISGKGGVGKTTIVANLGFALAEMGRNVLLIDADITMANLKFYFGLNESENTLHEILSGKIYINQAIYPVYENLKVLPCGTSIKGFLDADVGKLRKILEEVRNEYEFVIVDTSAGITKAVITAIITSDESILVVNPNLISLNAAGMLQSIAEQSNAQISGVILNRFNKTAGMEPDEVLDILRVPLLGIIPEDKNVEKAINNNEIMVKDYKKSKASKAFVEVADNLSQAVPFSDRSPKRMQKKQKAQGYFGTPRGGKKKKKRGLF